jgi:hypothetical protein
LVTHLCVGERYDPYEPYAPYTIPVPGRPNTSVGLDLQLRTLFVRVTPCSRTLIVFVVHNPLLFTVVLLLVYASEDVVEAATMADARAAAAKTGASFIAIYLLFRTIATPLS